MHLTHCKLNEHGDLKVMNTHTKWWASYVSVTLRRCTSMSQTWGKEQFREIQSSESNNYVKLGREQAGRDGSMPLIRKSPDLSRFAGSFA